MSSVIVTMIKKNTFFAYIKGIPMSQRVNWQEFDKLIVINRLRELVGKWWNVQMHFTDEKGFLRGVPSGKFFNPRNPISKAIAKDDKGFAMAMKDVKKTTVEAATSNQTKIGRSDSGFSTLLVPIKVKGKYLGCVFADGFIIEETKGEQEVAIKNFLQRLFGKDSDAISNEIASLPVLSSKDIEYLSELIQMVADEILMAQANLSVEQEKVEKLKGELGIRYKFDQMIGKSGKMQKLYALLDRVCDSEATVLIRGENGTGKELIARALHYNSKRKSKNFLVVNCGAFNENLLESELFGHTKGSFTGAHKDKKGLFEAADGGTLFLDEIGDTSPTMQVKLLRVLQEGTFTPVGSTEVKKAKVRVVAATNRDLESMIKDGSFREDLYYRLNVIHVPLPTLKERKEDIPVLVDHFLAKYADSHKEEPKVVDKDCMTTMLNYDWPGNVRELENEIERLCVLAGPDKTLVKEFLSQRIHDSESSGVSSTFTADGNLKDAIEQLEKTMILDGLKKLRWNKSKLAKQLGISRAGLINKVEKYGLDKRHLA